ncbi:hypothetical protein M4951_07935 [Blastopirellula sp. J2-11]|uniref:hypothetical protein n=1 Tax=Blastopirellula sp. J2-11 TaxID=2943192 RepID=UPI0021C56E8E|nr:hypothetical protein [Blastopirellula sp. J2-11]UUO08239.1 hypothetical protein M4951_07935 [Blastopirellula sp. J2-11]
MRILLFLSLLLVPLLPCILAAQVLQLPEWHTYSNSSSYLIPDRGAVYGGGVLRRAETSGEVGTPFLPSNRSFGVNTGATSTSATAWIHRPPEWALSHGQQQQPAGDDQSLRMIGASDLNQAAPDSLAAIRRQLSADDAAANQKAVKYANMAEDCVKQGKTSIAKLFLQSAISTAKGDYQAELKQRLIQISDTSTTKR